MRLVVLDYNEKDKTASVIDTYYMTTIVNDEGRVIRYDYKPGNIIHGYSTVPLEVGRTYSFKPTMRWVSSETEDKFIRAELDYDDPNISPNRRKQQS